MLVRLNTKRRYVINTAEIDYVRDTGSPDADGRDWFVRVNGCLLSFTEAEIAPLLKVMDAEEKHTEQFVQMMLRPQISVADLLLLKESDHAQTINCEAPAEAA